LTTVSHNPNPKPTNHKQNYQQRQQQQNPTMDQENRFLLTGGEGWICGHLATLLKSQGKIVHATKIRMEDKAGMSKVFDEFRPTRVINCAGKTGRPNVDWCESNRVETVRSNVIGTLMLAELCDEKGVHLTNVATGCK
jgi:3,5-epimerase/4-reductase